MSGPVDVVVVGAGAAGLMAAIRAGRAARQAGVVRRIVAVDGARKLGAKILVAGGGRCNVTHDVVDAEAFSGSSRPAIRKVLRRFDVPETVAFFAELGVALKREETGKLFPVSDQARTVLEALLRAAREAGVEILHPWRVGSIASGPEGFTLHRDGSADRTPWVGETQLLSRRVVLAAGGRSLPKSGSDGSGLELARSLGHTVTPHVLPGLVPLTLPRGHVLCALRGVSFPAGLELRSGGGKRLERMTGSLLCAHFGVSGPVVLDMSRHVLHARRDDPGAHLVLDVLPGVPPEELDRELRELGARTPLAMLRRRLPERLAAALVEAAGLDPTRPGSQLTRDDRRRLGGILTEFRLEVTGDRGFTHAEVTAGGVPLEEIRLETMESRRCPGLFLCGEICDVDGRIGGYNFQWAWASGAVAGIGVVG